MKLIAMDEFSIISHYFQNKQALGEDVIVASGDDCAVLSLAVNKELLITTDTLLEGTHFLADFPVEAIIQRAFIANLSDICAMGGRARWLSLSITMPEFNSSWLERLSAHLFKLLSSAKVQLVGGDLSRGPLSITMSLKGDCDKGKAITRAGAKPNNLIFVSNTLGEVSYAVSKLDSCPKEYQSELFEKLLYPNAQTVLASLLAEFATSCIDVSDGLVQDLAHVLKKSKVGATLCWERLPTSRRLRAEVGNRDARDYALSSGEEFELCFTVPPAKEEALMKAVSAQGLVVNKIGVITEKQHFVIRNQQGVDVPINVRGYKHF